MHIISGINLFKSYQDSDQVIEVLCDSTLEVNTAELICITGKSGCGKSTLLHILGLLDAPDKGKIIIGDREITSTSAEAPKIRNQELGFVFQFHYLVEDLSAVENVALPLLIAGTSTAKALQRARELLSLLGLEHRLSRYPNQLSGGEQQRVSLARALVNKPRIVLADEPTGNLDPGHSTEVWEMMQKLNKEMGQAFIVVTHDTEAAKRANKVYELRQGALFPG